MTTQIKTSELAIHGGTPAKSVSYGKGKRFDEAEEEAVLQPIRAQKLWYKQGGTQVPAAEATACKLWGIKHAITVSSGTAAVHTALVICGVEAGDEVIVNPISDWGSVCGILALGAIPVFCDITEDSYSLDPVRVKAAITKKTRAIVVVHIGGYPAHVEEIVAIARQHNIKVIEDCAQAHHAKVGGRFVGTLGDAGTFAVSDAKHISCGEGGLVITNDDRMAEIAFQFRDKAYARDQVRGTGDVLFLGYNYRMAELNAAVLNVQLSKLPSIIERRRAYSACFRRAFGETDGFSLLNARPGTETADWFILGHLEQNMFRADRKEISQALAAEGVPVWPALAPARTLYDCTAIRKGCLYPYNRTGPAGFLQGRTYPAAEFPVAEMIADSVISLHCNEFFTDQDAEETAAGLRKVLTYYHK